MLILNIYYFFIFNSKKAQSKTAPKRKPRQPRSAKSGWSLFSDSEDEVEHPHRTTESVLPSVLTRRVPDGTVRRTAQLHGDLYIELKLYNTKDIKNVDPLKRWEKALVNLKFQTNNNSSETESITKFIKLCREHFPTDGTFFSNK